MVDPTLAEIERLAQEAAENLRKAYARGHADGMLAGRRIAMAEAEDAAREALIDARHQAQAEAAEAYERGQDAARADWADW